MNGVNESYLRKFPMKSQINQENRIKQLIIKVSRFDDPIAFRDLFNFFYPRLLNFSQYFLESKYAANEVISTVFISLWKNRNKLERIKRFENYVFKSTKNYSLNYLRDNHRLRFEKFDEHEVEIKKSVKSPEDHFINNEIRAKILEALDNLPTRCRLIFELVKEEGLKYKEVAELLDISEKTVENQMGNAYSKLRTELSQYKRLLKEAM